MNEQREEYELLISGYLDGELSAGDRERLDRMLAESPAIRREFETMTQIVSGTQAALHFTPPPDEIWDSFLEDVYNKMERKTGWLFLIAGIVLLAIFGAYEFISEPWDSALLKIAVALPVIGFAILFLSVLRQRLRAAKHDRYSREIHR